MTKFGDEMRPIGRALQPAIVVIYSNPLKGGEFIACLLLSLKCSQLSFHTCVITIVACLVEHVL